MNRGLILVCVILMEQVLPRDFRSGSQGRGALCAGDLRSCFTCFAALLAVLLAVALFVQTELRGSWLLCCGCSLLLYLLYLLYCCCFASFCCAALLAAALIAALIAAALLAAFACCCFAGAAAFFFATDTAKALPKAARKAALCLCKPAEAARIAERCLCKPLCVLRLGEL
jgi:hypothetical protein